jgi:hypothetical protein
MMKVERGAVLLCSQTEQLFTQGPKWWEPYTKVMEKT